MSIRWVAIIRIPWGIIIAWFDYFKVLVTTAIPDPANSDDISDILEQADWEDHFGSSLRVYERKHPFPGLLVNYDDGSDVVNNYDRFKFR